MSLRAGPRLLRLAIVGAGFGLEVLIGALLFHAYGAYVVLMREEFGWSRTLFSAAFAMARAESALLGPVQGWLTDRFGPRALMRVGMVVFGLGFILFSRIGSPVEFFVAVLPDGGGRRASAATCPSRWPSSTGSSGGGRWRSAWPRAARPWAGS